MGRLPEPMFLEKSEEKGICCLENNFMWKNTTKHGDRESQSLNYGGSTQELIRKLGKCSVDHNSLAILL